jgi:hypothetical protein
LVWLGDAETNLGDVVIMSPLVSANLGLILRPTICSFDPPLELVPTTRIEKLPSELLQTVQGIMSGLDAAHLTSRIGSDFESHKIHPASTGLIVEEPLDEADYRYIVLHSDVAPQFERARLAARLLEKEVPIGLQFTWEIAGASTSHAVSSSDILALTRGGDKNFVLELKETDVAAWVILLQRLLAIDAEQYPIVYRAVRLFENLDYIPYYVPLYVLGHFSILESLLAHKPDIKDPQDSITKQLRRNVALLANRLTLNGYDALGISAWPNGMSVGKIMSRLYEYRSAIAHGGDVSLIAREPFRTVGWLELNRWIRSLTKKMIWAAIAEPQLVTDLSSEG